MMYRLGFPLLIVAVLATLGIASAMGRNVLPDTVLDFLNGSAPSSERSEVANLTAQPSRQDERRSSAVSNGGTELPAGAFRDFFEMAQAANFSDATASLTFPQDSENNGAQVRGFVYAPGYSSSSSSSSSGSSGGNHLGSVWKLSGSNGSGSGGSSGSGGTASASSGGSSGSGSGDGGSTNGLPQSLLLASLMTGPSDSESNDSTPNPVSLVDSGILPKVTEIPQAEFVPQKDDPLLGAPLGEVIPGPEDNRNPDPAPVPNPEPGTLILGGIGLVIMAVARRRMKSRQGE